MSTIAQILREEGIKIGIAKGEIKGEAKGLNRTAVKLLTKKFGAIPEEYKQRLAQQDNITLDIIIDGIFDYESLDEIEKYLR